MYTQVPTIVSLANFLYELKDLKSSIEHYQKAVTRRGVLKIGKKKAVISEGLKLTDIPGWANATFLDVNFNVLPMCSDLLKLTQVWGRVAARLDFLRHNRGKPVRQSFINTDLWSENPYVGQVLRTDYHQMPALPSDHIGYYMGANNPKNHSTYGDGNTQLYCDAFGAQFSAVWTLVQDVEGLDDAWAMLRGLIAGLGFNNPAKIVWNAIPFSFILDWMLPFGSVLDRLAVQPFYGRWDVYDVTNSVKEVYYIQERRNYNQGLDGVKTLKNPIYVQRYRRDLGLDLDLTSLDFTDLTKQQQSLVGSLAAQLTLFKSGRKTT
jgi:hypothetical protein